jgi:putative flippase GtrA
MRPLFRGHRRALRFALVGVLCFGVQYLALRLLVAAGLSATPADAVGFLLSAQLNFTLSMLFTWGDRKKAFTGTQRTRWASFNASVLITLALNTGVFQLCRPIGDLPASAFGVIVGAVGNYAICDLLVFRTHSRTRTRTTAVPTERVRAMAEEPR